MKREEKRTKRTDWKKMPASQFRNLETQKNSQS
jgi:hypothetical protein